jgi:DNA repair exonuclease SbcCD ATPase subunit
MQEIKDKLEKIQEFIQEVTSKMDHYVKEDEVAHKLIEDKLENLEKKEERIESRMDAFFESVDVLKSEISKMNVNMATYNAHLGEHMRRTALAEERLEKTEAVLGKIVEQQVNQNLEIEKAKVKQSTVVKVFVGIAGVVGFVYTVLQILAALK